MLKRIFTPIKPFLLIFACLILLTSYKLAGPIILQDEPLPFKPAGFYIVSITDERAVKTPVAQLITKTPGNKITTQAVDLQGGALGAVSRFIEHNLSKDQSLRPVIVSLKEFNLVETALPNDRVEGHVKLYLSFGLQKDYGTEQLVDYHGGLHYIRSTDNTAAIEPQLRRTLKNGLVYFNNWIKANANDNPKLAKDIKISFTDYSEQPEGDTIYYSANRPLTWADFQSKIAATGPYSAEVMPGIGYIEQSKMINGIIYVSVSMKAYLPKSTCWASIRDDITLNHEQRHFDITKIIAEQYKQKVLAQRLTPDTYEAFLNMQYLDSYRDMHEMQTAYDKETRHGKDQFAQSAWNDRIDKELNKQ